MKVAQNSILTIDCVGTNDQLSFQDMVKGPPPGRVLKGRNQSCGETKGGRLSVH